MRHKTALVTGAASGIGLALAADLSKQGFRVCLTDADEQAVTTAAQSLNGAEAEVLALPLDVTNQEHISGAVSRLENEWGGVDVLINNAGIQHVASLEDFPVDRWKLLTEILLVGPALLSRAVLPSMRARNFGRIVNVGSIHSLVASPHKSAYVAAKHGLLGFSKTVALETADCDITINTLCPSYVKTALVQKQISSQALAHGISEDEVINKIMLEPMPKKSFIDMDELCGAMNFLLSDAARNMTGQEMVIDGGWTIR